MTFRSRDLERHSILTTQRRQIPMANMPSKTRANAFRPQNPALSEQRSFTLVRQERWIADVTPPRAGIHSQALSGSERDPVGREAYTSLEVKIDPQRRCLDREVQGFPGSLSRCLSLARQGRKKCVGSGGGNPMCFLNSSNLQAGSQSCWNPAPFR